ncbi:uncharacterized protein SETTUDRAFT_43915 [Exserohilum turcica Et28A]|uniref:Uncharacterized protein n=1 Tax=Exserohilum turcicum (strain 28A) TaxID=671987 RepID=R0I982_EXST2|nr:uncharacterized protein SETTUDRAFT_43915 [Exserohilum turcica Et28A]EOA81946.1 hypothetical protein SETTUDRAFT_43915 [Exserohilum turcica Et28A]
MSLLESQQKSLVNAQVTRGDFQQLITPSIRRLTAGILHRHQATDGLIKLAQSLPPLESLSLIFKIGVDEIASSWWGENGYEENLPAKRIATHQLTLDGILPEKLYHNLPYLFDLSRLTKLALYDFDVNCWSWKDHLASSPDLRNLKHFDLHSRDSRHTFHRDWEFFDGLLRKEDSDILRDMFVRNKDLRHLSLHIFSLAAMSLEPVVIGDEDLLNVGADTTPYLWPLRRNLKTLSLLDMMSTIKRSVQFPSKSELDAICNDFGALEQLGLRVPEHEGHYYTNAAEIHTHVLGHLESIRKLKNLRIVHLYQDRVRLSHAEPSERDPWEQTSTFANIFFQSMHTSCPHLKVLVWGRFTETVDDEMLDMFDMDPDQGQSLLQVSQVERVRQQCFVKQVTEDKNGALRITALRVTRKQLQIDFPDLDILSCDTSISVKDRLSREILY